MPPPIPPITDPELIEAVSALTRAADSYRKAFLPLADRLLVAGGGDNENFRYVLKKGGDALQLSDAIIDAWRHQLGHDTEDAENGVKSWTRSCALPSTPTLSTRPQGQRSIPKTPNSLE